MDISEDGDITIILYCRQQLRLYSRVIRVFASFLEALVLRPFISCRLTGSRLFHPFLHPSIIDLIPALAIPTAGSIHGSKADSFQIHPDFKLLHPPVTEIHTAFLTINKSTSLLRLSSHTLIKSFPLRGPSINRAHLIPTTGPLNRPQLQANQTDSLQVVPTRRSRLKDLLFAV